MSEQMDREPRHPIGVVAKRTGLTTEVIRAWEQRYGAVDPGRSDGGQRLYSEADVRRLGLLAAAVAAGHRIGAIVSMDEGALAETVRALGGEARGAGVAPEARVEVPDSADVVAQALDAVTRAESRELGATLRRAALLSEPMPYLEQVVVPFLEELGARWERGELTPAHEHLASGVVRDALTWLLDNTAPARRAPLLLVGIPRGERHEFGALLAGIVGGLAGWSVMPLGGDLPARAIGGLARQTNAQAVALSVAHFTDGVADELELLRSELPDGVALLVGGRAAASALPREIAGVERIEGLAALRERLDRTVGAEAVS